MNAFKTYFLDVVTKNYVGIKGRASRKEFWMYLLFVLITYFVAALLFGFLGKTGNILYYFTVAALFLPNVCITIRRLHDTDRSGWWFLLNFIPIANLVLLVFLVLPGTLGLNRFNK